MYRFGHQHEMLTNVDDRHRVERDESADSDITVGPDRSSNDDQISIIYRSCHCTIRAGIQHKRTQMRGLQRPVRMLSRSIFVRVAFLFLANLHVSLHSNEYIEVPYIIYIYMSISVLLQYLCVVF